MEPAAALAAEQTRLHHPLEQRGRRVQGLLELLVEGFRDGRDGVQADQVGEFERAHRVGAAQFHSGVHVLGGGEPRFGHADGREEVRDQQRVDHETGPVLGADGGLAQGVAGEGLHGVEGVARGVEGGDDLHERQDGDGVEEVQAHDPVGAAGGHAQAHDRDGRGVRGEDRFRVRHDLVEAGEDLDLGFGVLGHGLDDELPVGEVLQVTGEDEPGQGVLGGDPVQFAALHGPFEGDGDAFPGGPGRGGLRLGNDGVEAGAGAHLGDAGAHLAAADDADPVDCRDRRGHQRFSVRRTRWRV